MNDSILIAYASKYGATKEIAEKIGKTLSEASLQVEVKPVNQVQDPSSYKAVILGSAIYIGKWQKEAVKFLQANEKTLTDRPTWLFASGPTGKGDPVTLLDGWHLPPELQPLVDRIKPRDTTIFHGYINPEKINFIEKWAVTKIVKKPLGDFRDWNMIKAWATKITDTLKNT